jgi:hypothetical protein
MFSCVDYLETRRAIRGKWIILDQTVESGLAHKFRAPKVVAPTQWGPNEQVFDYVLVHMGFMGSHKLSSFNDR